MKPIGTLGTIPTLTIGGRVFTDLENLITLAGHASTGGSTESGLKRIGPAFSTAYQVPASKALRVLAVKLGIAGNGVLQLDLGYNDAALTAQVAFGALVNPVFASSGTSIRNNSFISAKTSPGVLEQDFGEGFLIPAGKYPIASNISTTLDVDVQIYCYLEDA